MRALGMPASEALITKTVAPTADLLDVLPGRFAVAEAALSLWHTPQPIRVKRSVQSTYLSIPFNYLPETLTPKQQVLQQLSAADRTMHPLKAKLPQPKPLSPEPKVSEALNPIP